VMAHGMALRQHPTGQGRMGKGIAAEHEKVGVHALLPQGGQDAIGGAGPRSIVESQHQFLGRERKRARKLLAADRRCCGRIDRQHARGAERRWIAGAAGGIG